MSIWEHPQETPRTRWKDSLIRIKKDVEDNHLSLIAAGMAYYALFAFIPAITSVVLIYAWVSDPSEISNHIKAISEFIPKEVQAMLKEQLGALSSTAPSALGLSAIGSLLIALWSASKGSKAIIEALNIIYDEKEERGFIKFNSLALGLTFLGIVIGLLAIATVIVVPLITGIFDFGPMTEIIATVASWSALLLLFSIFLSFTYRFAPDRENAKWKWVSWGGFISAIMFAGASALFAWYANEFGNFNKTYGSFGAIIVLMLWFYISSFVILLGAEINAELEQIVPEKPLSKRKAKMADDKIKTSGAKTSDAQDHHRGLWH